MLYIYALIGIIIFILALTYLIPTNESKKDHFYDNSVFSNWGNFNPGYPDYYNSGNFNPGPLRSTRGMSHDLRGDVQIPDTGFVPIFNMSTLRPIRNKPLWMVS